MPASKWELGIPQNNSSTLTYRNHSPWGKWMLQKVHPVALYPTENPALLNLQACSQIFLWNKHDTKTEQHQSRAFCSFLIPGLLPFNLSWLEKPVSQGRRREWPTSTPHYTSPSHMPSSPSWITLQVGGLVQWDIMTSHSLCLASLCPSAH